MTTAGLADCCHSPVGGDGNIIEPSPENPGSHSRLLHAILPLLNVALDLMEELEHRAWEHLKEKARLHPQSHGKAIVHVACRISKMAALRSPTLLPISPYLCSLTKPGILTGNPDRTSLVESNCFCHRDIVRRGCILPNALHMVERGEFVQLYTQ